VAIYYLCSGTSVTERMEAIAMKLRSRGHQVFSRWHSGKLGSPRLELGDPALIERAEDDLEDLTNSDVIVAFTGTKGRGGRHFELGFAFALGLGLVLIGEPEHAFHTLPKIEAYTDEAAWLATVEPKEEPPF
jgi:hypothetical protein